MLIFDILIFSLTLYKAFTIGRGIKLLDVIVRDGASNHVLPCTFNLNPSISISGAMYFSYELRYFFADQDLDDSEQGTLYNQSGKYFDPSGTPYCVYQLADAQFIHSIS